MRAARAVVQAEIGRAVLPYPGERLAADGCVVVRHTESIAMLALFDIAGHGAAAAKIATELEAALHAMPDEPPPALLVRCHAALKGRPDAAAVAWVARLDLAAATAEVACVGDISFAPDAHKGPMLQGDAGQLGVTLPTIRPLLVPLAAGATWVVCSDGVRSAAWAFVQANLTRCGAQALADAVVRQFGRKHDDASCLVVRFGAVAPGEGSAC